MRRIFKLALILLALALSAAGYYLHPILSVGSAYKAKTVCSAVFLSGREPASVLAEDVHAENLHLLDAFRTTIDHEKRSVTASLSGLFRRTAVYREGIGATLAMEIPPEDLQHEKRPLPPAPNPPDAPWPTGEAPSDPPPAKLESVLATAFDEPDPEHLRRTRAVVIVHRGRLAAERYAPGFTPSTPLAGWSMTKSATNALIGILVRQEKLSLQDNGLLERWTAPGDTRAAITLDNLLRMSSGLSFVEDYDNPRQDVTTMLYRTGDASSFSAAKTLHVDPGSGWKYTSGTTNILSLVMRETLGDDGVYHAFPYRELFHPIGMRSAMLERDASGNFVGSSFMYATARDWARLGLLYANDGLWEGRRILPEKWVAYSTSAAPGSPAGIYGAHIWRRVIRHRPDVDRESPLPGSAFHFCGHEGQYVTVVPEKNLVVVRLGLTLQRTAWDQEGFVSRVLATLPD
jgi:CubicO group peptidase (beta-lactamase class C family)